MVMLYSLALSAVLSHEVSSVRVYFFSFKKIEDQHVKVTMLYVESIKF